MTTSCTLSASLPASESETALPVAIGTGVERNTFTSSTTLQTAADDGDGRRCAFAGEIAAAKTGASTAPKSSPVPAAR